MQASELPACVSRFLPPMQAACKQPGADVLAACLLRLLYACPELHACAAAVQLSEGLLCFLASPEQDGGPLGQGAAAAAGAEAAIARPGGHRRGGVLRGWMEATGARASAALRLRRFQCVYADGQWVPPHPPSALGAAHSLRARACAIPACRHAARHHCHSRPAGRHPARPGGERSAAARAADRRAGCGAPAPGLHCAAEGRVAGTDHAGALPPAAACAGRGPTSQLRTPGRTAALPSTCLRVCDDLCPRPCLPHRCCTWRCRRSPAPRTPTTWWPSGWPRWRGWLTRGGGAWRRAPTRRPWRPGWRRWSCASWRCSWRSPRTLRQRARVRRAAGVGKQGLQPRLGVWAGRRA